MYGVLNSKVCCRHVPIPSLQVVGMNLRKWNLTRWAHVRAAAVQRQAIHKLPGSQDVDIVLVPIMPELRTFTLS
jgi:hypothetical protein